MVRAQLENILGTYEPPLTDPRVITGNLYVGHLAPGVLGVALASDRYIYIPSITAETEGNGDVGRFLDSLSPRCLIAIVISDKLKGMLIRRGWRSKTRQLPKLIARLIWENDEDFVDAPVDVWSRA